MFHVTIFKGVFWFAVWFWHAFSRIYCKQTTENNERNFFVLNKAFQFLIHILFWVYCLVTRDIRMTLAGTLKKHCDDDWACPGDLKQKTQIQFYLLFHWLSLHAQLAQKSVDFRFYSSSNMKKMTVFRKMAAIFINCYIFK